MCLSPMRNNPNKKGPLAQLGERLICIQEVSGSIPLGSTNLFLPGAITPSLSAKKAYSGTGVSVEKLSKEQ